MTANCETRAFAPDDPMEATPGNKNKNAPAPRNAEPNRDALRFIVSEACQSSGACAAYLSAADNRAPINVGVTPQKSHTDCVSSLTRIVHHTKQPHHISAPLAGSRTQESHLLPPHCSAASAFPLIGITGKALGVLVLLFENTQWQRLPFSRKTQTNGFVQTLQALLAPQIANTRTKAFLNIAADWTWERNADGQTVTYHCSKRPPSTSEDLLTHALHNPAYSARFKTLIDSRVPFRDERQSVDVGTGKKTVSLSGEPVFTANGDYLGCRGIARDVSEEEAYTKRIRFQAKRDPLTGLANRTTFKKQLKRTFDNWMEHGDRGTLFHLDLDKFKLLNDTYGHAFGDQILKVVARRLKTIPSEEATIARLGGDEFAIIDPALFRRVAIKDCAQALIRTLNEPLEINGTCIRLGCSIGISVLPEDGATGEQLLGNADLALYSAKKAGRNRFHFFTPQMRSKVEAKEAARQAIGEAHRANEIGLKFLEIRDMDGDTLLGAEAILTCARGEVGAQHMRALRSTLAQTDEAVEIGTNFIRRACTQMADWNQRLDTQKFVSVALNPAQAEDPNLSQTISRIVAETGLGYSNLQLNILPESLRRDSVSLKRHLLHLSELGVALGLVDYGSLMVSPFHYVSAGIKKLNLDLSQIDRLDHHSTLQSLGRALVNFAHQLGCEVCVSGYQGHLDDTQVKTLGGRTYLRDQVDDAVSANALETILFG